jgi:hypothetical protein
MKNQSFMELAFRFDESSAESDLASPGCASLRAVHIA